MKPTHGNCDQYMAEGQPCSGWRRLEDKVKWLRAEGLRLTHERNEARAEVERLRAGREGWVWVPRVATPEMQDAGVFDSDIDKVWTAMVDAAPKPLEDAP